MWRAKVNQRRYIRNFCWETLCFYNSLFVYFNLLSSSYYFFSRATEVFNTLFWISLTFMTFLCSSHDGNPQRQESNDIELRGYGKRRNIRWLNVYRHFRATFPRAQRYMNKWYSRGRGWESEVRSINSRRLSRLPPLPPSPGSLPRVHHTLKSSGIRVMLDRYGPG